MSPRHSSFVDRSYGMSTLDIDGPGFGIEVRLVSRDGKRLRRSFLREFYQLIHPWLANLEQGSQPSARLDHVACGVIRSSRAAEGIRPFQQGDSKILGSEIQKRRLNAGLSQQELARKIRIQRSHLSDIERGIHRPKTETLREILEALKTPSPKGDLSHGSKE